MGAAPSPRIVDHTFYLFDDTDEHTRTLCGIGCGYGPEDHLSAEDWAARERLRDAAPALRDALITLSDGANCWCPWASIDGYHFRRCEQARAALAAASPPAGTGEPT